MWFPQNLRGEKKTTTATINVFIQNLTRPKLAKTKHAYMIQNKFRDCSDMP